MIYLHGSQVDETHTDLRNVKSLADLKKLNIFSANAEEANADLWKAIRPELVTIKPKQKPADDFDGSGHD